MSSTRHRVVRPSCTCPTVSGPAVAGGDVERVERHPEQAEPDRLHDGLLAGPRAVEDLLARRSRRDGAQLPPLGRGEHGLGERVGAQRAVRLDIDAHPVPRPYREHPAARRARQTDGERYGGRTTAGGPCSLSPQPGQI
ncbi:hypothetical protein GA0115246_112673, partial [Streptomyces sp. SolWspMP-sol7th]